jgi:hypothetical protein
MNELIASKQHHIAQDLNSPPKAGTIRHLFWLCVFLARSSLAGRLFIWRTLFEQLNAW